MFALLQAFRRDCQGGPSIEYALVAALISIAAVASLTAIGPKLNHKYEQVLPALN